MRFPLLYLSFATLLWGPGTRALGGWDDPEMGRPICQVFGPGDYGFTSFNWSVGSDKSGHVYAGNDQLLEYDGKRWAAIPIGSAYQVKGITVDDQDRIWVGADTDFGYLEKLETGQRVFHSLKPFIPTGVKLVGFWSTHWIGGNAVFVTNESVAWWNGKRLNVKRFHPSSRLMAVRYHDKLLISAASEGVWLFDGNSFEPVAWNGIENKVIGWVSEISETEALLGTDYGILRLSGNQTHLLDTPATTYLNRSFPTGAVRLKNGTTAVSTIYGGILFVDDEGQPIRLLDRSMGLQSQNVTGLHVDSSGNLWVSTTRSIVRMDCLPSESFFDASNGLNGGLSMRLVPGLKDGLVSLSEECVFKLKKAADWQTHATFNRIPRLDQFFWDAVPADEEYLLVGGFMALDAADNRERRHLKKELPDVTRLFRDSKRPGRFFALTVQKLFSFTYQDGNYGNELELATIPEQAQDSLIDKNQVVWLTTLQQGIFAISTISEEVKAVRHFERGVELPLSFKKNRLFRVGGQVYAYDGNQVLKLGTGPASPENHLANWSLSAVQQEGENHVYAVGNEAGGPNRLLNLRLVEGALEPVALECRNLGTVGKAINIEAPEPGKALWISGSDGLLRVTEASLHPIQKPPAPTLFSVEWKNAEGAQNLPLQAAPELVFIEGSAMSFELRDPTKPLEKDLLIETRLRGYDDTWKKDRSTVTYGSLREGNYVFEARLLSLSEMASEVATYNFVIRPPWQRSPWAYGFYGLLGLGGIWVLASFRLRQIARRNAELESLVNERTDALTRATAAKSAFLANMGHEILNPLNGVVGLVENLRESKPRDDQREVIGQLSNCATQLVSVVEDVLEYSRIEAGTFTIRMKAFPLGEPVQAAVDIFRAVQHTQAAPITVDVSTKDWETPVFGAPDRIRQILVNYISNAMKFGAGTPITVAVKRENEDTVFRVTDQGPGVPLDEQAALFHRFQRSKASRRNDIPGTGLGLAACKAYAEAMGGEVWLQSTPGEGASFFLRVPMRAASPADSAPTVVTHDNLAGKRVLVLDDHEFNRKVLCDLVSRMGATASSAENIPEAKTLFAANPPDLVFVDLDLGHASGFEFAHWIRKEAPSGRDVPAIATTAFALDEVRKRCEEAGMDGFIAKPVSAWKIREVVARIDNVRGGAATPSPRRTPSEAEGGSLLALLADGNPETMVELQQRARGEIRREAAEITLAVRRRDSVLAASHAHRLISVAVMAGNPSLLAAAKALHQKAREGDWAEVTKARAALAAEVVKERHRFKNETKKAVQVG